MLLSDYLEGTKTNPNFIICQTIALQISNAIIALNKMKLCHYNINSSSIVLMNNNGQWTAKLMNFSQAIQDDFNNGKLQGSRGLDEQFSAPELMFPYAEVILEGNLKIKFKADVWSFGIVLLKMFGMGFSASDSLWTIAAKYDPLYLCYYNSDLEWMEGSMMVQARLVWLTMTFPLLNQFPHLCEVIAKALDTFPESHVDAKDVQGELQDFI